jgi:hypothetical protein
MQTFFIAIRHGMCYKYVYKLDIQIKDHGEVWKHQKQNNHNFRFGKIY